MNKLGKVIKKIVLFGILTLIYVPVVNAAGTATVGFSGSSSVQIGDTITLTMNISNVSGTNNNIGVLTAGGFLVFDSSYLQYVSGTNKYTGYSFQINPNASYKIAGLDLNGTKGIGRSNDGDICTGTSSCSVMAFTFKALKQGTTSVSFNVDKFYDDVSNVTVISNSKSVTITDQVATSSNNNTLSSLGITGQTLSPAFSSSVTSYKVTVPYQTSSVTVTGAASDSKASVNGLGSKNLDVGVNNIVVTVTAENGTTKNYTLVVTRSSKTTSTTTTTNKSNNSYLSSLKTNLGYEIYPEFNKNTTSYSITVPNDVNSLNLQALTEDKTAKVEILGDKDFVVSKVNVVTVLVTAADGTTRTYTINVSKSSLDSNTDLSSLKVSEEGLSPSFDPKKYEYTLKVANGVNDLDVEAIAKDTKSTIEIIGENDLDVGKNIVKVKVTDNNGFTKIYKIVVQKADKPALSFLGLGIIGWGAIGALILFSMLLFLILRKKKEVVNTTPTFEFKPEFNFNSKNYSDDDINDRVIDADYHEKAYIPHRETKLLSDDVVTASVEEIPYDPYDDIVTKDELVDAIEEAMTTKDPSKLEMLLEQENINRTKEKIKKRRKARTRSSYQTREERHRLYEEE